MFWVIFEVVFILEVIFILVVIFIFEVVFIFGQMERNKQTDDRCNKGRRMDEHIPFKVLHKHIRGGLRPWLFFLHRRKGGQNLLELAHVKLEWSLIMIIMIWKGLL